MFDLDANKYFCDKVNVWCDRNQFFHALAHIRWELYDDMCQWEQLIREILCPSRVFWPDSMDTRALQVPNVYLTISP